MAEAELSKEPGILGGEAKVEGPGTVVEVDRWAVVMGWWAALEPWGVRRMQDAERGALLHDLSAVAAEPANVPMIDDLIGDLGGQLLMSGLARARRLSRELGRVLVIPGHVPPRLAPSADPDIAAFVGVVEAAVKAAGRPVGMLELLGGFRRSVRDISESAFKKKLSLLSRTSGPILKVAKRGLYTTPTTGAVPYVSISQRIAQLVPKIPPYATAHARLVAALAPLGFTVAQINGGLNQMRNVNGLLVKAAPDRKSKGLVMWSASTIAKFQSGETLRDDSGDILWSPDVSLMMANADASLEAPRSEASSARKPSSATVDPPLAAEAAPSLNGYDLFCDQPTTPAIDAFDGLLANHSPEELAQLVAKLSPEAFGEIESWIKRKKS